MCLFLWTHVFITMNSSQALRKWSPSLTDHFSLHFWHVHYTYFWNRSWDRRLPKSHFFPLSSATIANPGEVASAEKTTYALCNHGPGVGNVFCTADRFKIEIFSRTGLWKTTNVQQWIFITTHISYFNFDSMRTLSLFCRNETLPPRNYGTHWHPQFVPHLQSVSRFRFCCCHHRTSRLA